MTPNVVSLDHDDAMLTWRSTRTAPYCLACGYVPDAVEEVKIPAPPKEQKASANLSMEQIYERLRTINEQVHIVSAVKSTHPGCAIFCVSSGCLDLALQPQA